MQLPNIKHLKNDDEISMRIQILQTNKKNFINWNLYWNEEKKLRHNKITYAENEFF